MRRTRRTNTKSSFFRKMKEATIRPKNYATFHTVCDSDSYQGKGKAKQTGNCSSSSNWKSEWMKGTGDKATGPVAVQENEMERRLRSENDLLKARLNAANNAIRNMEKTQKKQEKQAIRDVDRARKEQEKQDRAPGTSPLRFFLDTMRNTKQASIPHDDKSSFSAAVASQAETVKMGSSSKNRQHASKTKNKKHRDNNNRGNGESTPKSKFSCSKSLVYGSKLRKKLAKKEAMERMKREQMGRFEVITPPCTPERKNKDIKTSSPDSMQALDILKDISSSILGIRNFRQQKPVEKGKREDKLLALSRLSTTTLISQSHSDNGNVQYSYAGKYPIDVYQATPVSDDYSDEEEYLSVIHEINEYSGEECSDEDDRVEI
jgi:hypothetical protein